MKRMSGIAGVLGVMVLAACGGGGGGGDAPAIPDTPPLALTAANSVDVARATLGGVRALAQTPVPVGGIGVLDSDRAAAFGIAADGVRRAAAPGADPRRHAAAADRVAPAVLVPLDPESCPAGGSWAMTIDDRNSNGSFDDGDGWIEEYRACQLSATERIDGTMVTGVSSSTDTSFAGSLAFRQLTVTQGSESSRLNGEVQFAFAMFAADSRMDIVVAAAGLEAVSTGPSGTDSLFYLPGLAVVLTDTTAALDGSFDDSTLGGRLRVTTVAPVVRLAGDANPRSGQMVVDGAASRLRITVVDTAQVRLELDADGNGTFDSASLVGWSQLQ